jgi:hypothetical protein
MAKGRNPEFIKVEKFINSGKGTIADYRKLNPDAPAFKVKIGSIANKNAIVSYKKAGTTDAVTRRAAQIKKNRPTDEVFNEAGKLWDELVGDKGSFTMGGKTFTSKEQYQKFESKQHDRLTKQKAKLNRKGGTTHGHAVPPKHKFAVESYMQSFPEDASANYASQDKVPADFDQRLDKAGVPKDKTTVAKRHVGTEDLIKDLPKDAKVEKILKTDSQKALKFIKAKKGFKFIARKSIPYVSGALALSSFGGSVHAMTTEGFSKKTGTDLAFRTADLALEGVDALTGGLSTPVTLALQLALAGAENTINQGAAKISTSDRKKFR